MKKKTRRKAILSLCMATLMCLSMVTSVFADSSSENNVVLDSTLTSITDSVARSQLGILNINMPSNVSYGEDTLSLSGSHSNVTFYFQIIGKAGTSYIVEFWDRGGSHLIKRYDGITSADTPKSFTKSISGSVKMKVQAYGNNPNGCGVVARLSD